MKTHRTHLFALLALSSLFGSLGRADEDAHAKILKERDSVLSQIVAQRENSLATSSSDDQALAAARLALWSFRRDTTPSRTEKIKQQELIVGLYEKKLENVKAMDRAGMALKIQILEAMAPLLEARQVLEELRSNDIKR